MKKNKSILFEKCRDYLKERINRIKSSLNDLDEALANEIKSSAGDKYETSREMINAEINQLSGQLKQFKEQEEILELAIQRKESGKIQLGSLVKTTAANYLICISVRKLEVENEIYFAIGANSPIAKNMLDKTEGDSFSFQQKEILIREVQ
ncbi:transcription elongation factor [Mesonia maritima]|uniref:Transcription elongation GreA/GreB family factor n=1 Tax=Mesonia maritima TaxID=1793873 RepID=A0ABU1K2C1_9FLAO|nr:transcription elongation factor [Mesonia maritima]MDR6299750.1 transcription elongation GreA/GreB family factor [Mesonia maritima]